MVSAEDWRERIPLGAELPPPNAASVESDGCAGNWAAMAAKNEGNESHYTDCKGLSGVAEERGKDAIE